MLSVDDYIESYVKRNDDAQHRFLRRINMMLTKSLNHLVNRR
jgi:hypothetical protein